MTKGSWVIQVSSVKCVIVDTTMMEKAVAHPTDSHLLERCRAHLIKAAACNSPHLPLDQNPGIFQKENGMKIIFLT